MGRGIQNYALPFLFSSKEGKKFSRINTIAYVFRVLAIMT